MTGRLINMKVDETDPFRNIITEQLRLRDRTEHYITLLYISLRVGQLPATTIKKRTA